MKRIFVLLLTLSLLCMPALGDEESIAAGIREGKSFRLVSTHEALMDSLSDMPVFCSLAYADKLLEDMDEGFAFPSSDDGLRIRISNALSATSEDISFKDFRLLSVSPSGNSFLLDMYGVVFVVRNQEIMLLTVNRERGTQNKDSDRFYRYIESSVRFPSHLNSFCWSPDERYIAITSLKALEDVRCMMDLLIADTYTGDIFIAETTPKDMSLDGASTATTACFDSAGKYVYYLIFGKLPGNARSGLKRYCLETGEVELLAALDTPYFYYPKLNVSADGSVYAITDTRRDGETAGVITFTQVSSKWESEIRSFPNSRSLQRPLRYYRSEVSGYELFLSNAREYSMNYLTLCNEALGTGSVADALQLPTDGSGQAEFVEISKYLTANAQNTFEQSYVVHATLSPDGHFALILTAHKFTIVCYVLDLDTLICRCVEFPDAQSAFINTGKSDTVLSWLEGDSILIPEGDAGHLFKLFIE